MDALSIYTTYVALNALCPVSMPDEIRQQIEGIQQKIICTIINNIIMIGLQGSSIIAHDTQYHNNEIMIIIDI